MNKNIQYNYLIFTAIIAIIGFICLNFSVKNGLDSASEYLRSVGGSMDTDSFMLIQEKLILSNITLGGILLFVGLSFFCFGVYKLLKESK